MTLAMHPLPITWSLGRGQIDHIISHLEGPRDSNLHMQVQGLIVDRHYTRGEGEGMVRIG